MAADYRSLRCDKVIYYSEVSDSRSIKINFNNNKGRISFNKSYLYLVII